MRVIGIALLFVGITSVCDAHYNMLLPDKPWANKDEKVIFTYQFGHPFEHELFDAPKPAALVVITPKGKREILDIDKTLKPIKKDGADGKKVTAWQFTFTPPERGDYTFVVKTAKIKHEENAFLEDTVRVVLHVQTQNGWETSEAPFANGYDIWPYTRPYGLLPGAAFRGRFVQYYGVTPLRFREPASGPKMPPGSQLHWQIAVGAPIEIEKYNARPMKNLPPDELITFKAKADENGFFVASLPDPGWWSITGTVRDNVDEEAEPKTVIYRRATMWLHVDEKK